MDIKGKRFLNFVKRNGADAGVSSGIYGSLIMYTL